MFGSANLKQFSKKTHLKERAWQCIKFRKYHVPPLSHRFMLHVGAVKVLRSPAIKQLYLAAVFWICLPTEPFSVKTPFWAEAWSSSTSCLPVGWSLYGLPTPP